VSDDSEVKGELGRPVQILCDDAQIKNYFSLV
jgi:hypothetical protein